MSFLNPHSKQTARIEAFSDGVFAIAITLLVLDIHVPEVKGNQSLLTALLHQWTNHLAFLIGFFTILICWINHYVMFEYIHKSDSGLLLLNGLKLCVVSFTPFVTAVLSKYIGTPQQSMGVTVYAFNFLLMGSAMFGICFYACREGFVNEPPERQKAFRQLYTVAAILSATIFFLSFFNTLLALVFFVAMFFIFMSPRKAAYFLEKRQRKLPRARNSTEPFQTEAQISTVVIPKPATVRSYKSASLS